MRNNFQSKSVPRGTRTIWRYLGALFILFTFAIGNVWGAAGDATTSNAPKSGGTNKDYANTISVAAGYLDGNVMYYISNNLTFISTDGLEANYLGFVFKPSVDLTIDFEGFNGNSGDVNITYQIDSIADAAFYEVFTEAGSNKISEKIISDNGGESASSTHTVLNYWKNNGVVKYSSKKWQSNGDNAPKNLSGQQNTTYFGNTRLVTDKVVAISSTKSAAAGTYSFMRDATNKFVFKAGKVYRIYSTRGSSKTGYKSFTFTPVYQLTWNLDGGTITSAANAYTNAGYYSKGTELTAPTVTKSGSDFSGWSPAVAATMPAAATTYMATWVTACGAGVPGDLSKGALTAGKIKLTAEGSPASGDHWYWQAAEDGTSTSDEYDAVNGKEVASAGTYYLRSSNGTCWNVTAKSIVLTAEDFMATPEVTFENGAYVVGAAALDLSGLFTSDNTNTPSFALKVASEDATVSGSSFTATKAGSYVVVATQAADATYKAVEEEATITVTWPATGAATIIYNVAVGTSESSFTTANMDDNSASISNLVGFTANNIAPSGSGKAKSSPKLETPQNKVQNKYVSVTFDVAEGKEFVLDSVVTQIVAVSSDKTIEVVVVAGETKDSLNYSQGTNSDPGNSHQFNFSANAKAYTGTVTVKIYAYGATDGYRIGKPLKVCGKVQNAKVVKTTDYALTDVKVNGTSISAANLATLKTASAYKVDLADQFAAAPTIKFNKETTITYTDDSQKVTDEEISVDATTVDGKWQAQAEIGGITYTVTAVKVTSFTVNYFDEDGTTSLGSEVVSVTGHPNASEITVPTKSFKTFADWKLSGTVVDLNNVSAGAGESVDLVASYTVNYASSINIEQWVLDNSKNNTAFRAVLDARHYEYANLNDLDSLRADKNDGDRNEPYLGQKWKLATSEISFLLKSESTVRVKFGNVGSNVNIKLGDNAPIAKTAAQLESPYEYTATEDVIVRLQGTGTGTVVVKQIMIDDPIATVKLHAVVTYDAGAGTFGKENEKYTGTPLVIGDATPAADYTFAGWFLGEDQINAAAYEPTKNVTLVAHYAPQEFAIAYDGNGATSGSMDAGAAGWGTLVTPAVNAFEKTGNIFAGWVITKTSDGSDAEITFSEGKFEMPKFDVTLVAQWEDNSSVVKVVRDNYEQKYDNFLAARNDVRDNGGTIIVLQDITDMAYYGVNAAITIDLNGHRLATADGNDMFLVYDGGSLTINGAVEGSQVHGRINVGSNAGSDGTLVLNGGTYTCAAGNTCIHVHGESDNSVVTINGATITSPDDNGVQFNGKGVYTVTDATITGGTGIYIKSGVLTITNSTVTGTLTPQNYSYYGNGAYPTGDGIVVDACNYPGGAPTINIISGDFSGTKGAVGSYNYQGTSDPAIGGIEGGTFSSRVPNDLCAPGLVPSAANAQGKYSVEPKDGIEIIGVVVTGNTEGTVSGLYKGNAAVNLNSKKIDSGKYIYVTLKDGYTFEENDVLIVDVNAKSNLDGGNKALEITTGVGNIDGDVWKSIAFNDYTTGENIISLEGIAAGQTSIGLKRSANQNAKINGLRVLRPMKPMLTAIIIDERAGEIDPLDDKHFNVLIPFESELDGLTVVPTIVSNTAETDVVKTVESNGGEWVLGNNTYRVTDKDGDYTNYTITLTRDVKKYTVTFNAQGGSTVEPKLVVENTKLDAAPADPTREDYQFLGWAEATEGEVVDVTDIVISANKTFYAQWKYEDPIVMLDGDGHIDHVNFLTGLSEGTVNFGSADHNCVSFGSGNSTIVGKTGANKYIVYNAKTNKTRIKFVLYNKQNSPKNLILQKLAEGETETTDVVIEVPSKQLFTTEYYTYNSDDNRTMYVCSENTDIKVLQVKVIESGTPVKQAGEAGYSLNFNVGRVFAPSGSDVVYDGLAMKASSNYQVLTSEEFPTQSNLSFQVNELVTMTLVSTGAKYKVSKNPAGSGKEYAAGTNKHTLTQGTWYIVSSTGSNMKFTNISFEEPVADHTRDNLNPSFLGTLCWTNDAILGGATLYEFAGKDEHNYLVFDEVEENRLEAGKPYIFMPENGNTEIKVYNIDESDPMTESQLQPVNNMYGTLDGKTLVPGVDDNMYYFSSNHIWAVKDFTVNIPILPNRCYIDYPAVLAADSAPAAAPGRRRVTMGVNGQNVATGMGEIEASETPMKVMINGQIFIIRGEKMFDATGRLVK